MRNTSGHSSRESLLIINRQQFGYHIDTFYYCKYLRGTYDITYLCWDYGKPRIKMDGVSISYVSREGAKLLRYGRFLACALREFRSFTGIALLKYFPGCSLLRLSGRRKRVVLDIRSGTVARNAVVRFAKDAVLKFEARFFDHLTVISQSLARRLGLRDAVVHVVPLGAEVISECDKTFEDLRLIYVGALGRRIEETIIGLKEFLADEGKHVRCKYRIIGYGYRGEEHTLRDLCRQSDLEGIVEIVGFVPHGELVRYFDQSNIGVAYVPMTPYFDVQPPTKLFEYLLSGMPTIATATTENQRVIRRCNGVLIDSTVAGFRLGLREICRRRSEFSSREVRKSVSDCQWRQIVETNLLRYLQRL
jgi:glycosyltransferase involved in cell wall biosynthesis